MVDGYWWLAIGGWSGLVVHGWLYTGPISFGCYYGLYTSTTCCKNYTSKLNGSATLFSGSYPNCTTTTW